MHEPELRSGSDSAARATCATDITSTADIANAAADITNTAAATDAKRDNTEYRQLHGGAPCADTYQLGFAGNHPRTQRGCGWNA